MLCHHYECIFVHIPKTGGQSIENFFLDNIGLSWDLRAPLLLRSNSIQELGPPRLAHLTASEYIKLKYVSEKIFINYFKFSFVRNPWARLVSHYRYSRLYSLYPFKYFVKNVFLQRYYKKNYWFLRPQYEFLYSNKGQLLVDFVGKFECLDLDFKYVANKLGFYNPELLHINKSKNNYLERLLCKIPRFNYLKRSLANDYRDYYDIESRDVVSRLYEKDIELFEYEFF